MPYVMIEIHPIEALVQDYRNVKLSLETILRHECMTLVFDLTINRGLLQVIESCLM